MWFWAQLNKSVLGVYLICHDFLYKILPGVGTIGASFPAWVPNLAFL